MADQVRTVGHGPPPLDLIAVVRVMEFLGLAEDEDGRLELLVKLKTIHQAVTQR